MRKVPFLTQHELGCPMSRFWDVGKQERQLAKIARPLRRYSARRARLLSSSPTR